MATAKGTDRPAGSGVTKLFLSYRFPDEIVVGRINYYLSKQPKIETFFWLTDRVGAAFGGQITKAIEHDCNAFVYFEGRPRGENQAGQGATQGLELSLARSLPKLNGRFVFVWLPGAPGKEGEHELPIRVPSADGQDDCSDETCLEAARQIVETLGLTWFPENGVPTGYPFDYEKDIIKAYATDAAEGAVPDKDGRVADPRRVKYGCPSDWPRILREDATIPNPLMPDEIGDYRDPDKEIVVDPRSGSIGSRLTFPEAGPRALLSYPRSGGQGILNVGILVSGGIAPGTNAIIESIVCRHTQYWKAEATPGQPAPEDYQLQVLGYLEGFRALIDRGKNYLLLSRSGVEGWAQRGGSELLTSRAPLMQDRDPAVREKQMTAILGNLNADDVDILYVIGGDGSMRAAHAVSTLAKERGQRLSVVGIPKTTDNDILWSWQSVGLLSAVNKAAANVLDLSVEIHSNPRLCVLQLFGSGSGFVVGHAVLSAGDRVCDAALIPEVEFSMACLGEYIKNSLQKRFVKGDDGRRPYGMVVMSETAIPTDYMDYIDKDYVGLDKAEKEAIRTYVDNDRRVHGQTPDALRTGGLKIVSRVLEHKIQEQTGYWKSFRVFTNEPRHLIRAMPPSVTDLIVGQRLGTLAVDNAMAGYSDFMVSQWLTEYVLVPLATVVMGSKRVPPNGIFWKSVLAVTGQPADLNKSSQGSADQAKK
jgi:6-phosphofructokinase 1